MRILGCRTWRPPHILNSVACVGRCDQLRCCILYKESIPWEAGESASIPNVLLRSSSTKGREDIVGIMERTQSKRRSQPHRLTVEMTRSSLKTWGRFWIMDDIHVNTWIHHVLAWCWARFVSLESFGEVLNWSEWRMQLCASTVNK